jgi:peptidoglycan/LPS O-acetylase OafA/YrhL
MPTVLERAESSARTATTVTTPSLPHEPSLDGLRGAAVAAVVGYHLGISWLKGGFLGVSLFFTLSGFLITNLLLAERDRSGTIRLRAFWARRARRLLPAAFAGIALAVVVAAVAGTADQVRHLPGDVLGALAYAANWRFVFAHSAYQAGYQAPSPLLHYWSLAIEEQLYLFLPLLVLLAGRGRSRRALGLTFAVLLAGSAMAALAFGGHDPNRVYFGTDTRLFELVAGALLAVVMRFPRRVERGAAVGTVAAAGTLLLWITTAETSPWLYRGGLWLVAVASCSLIIGALSPGRLATVLRWRPLAALGRVSYGVYVYHWPLFLLLDAPRTGLHGLALIGLRLSATGAVAVLSFRYVEQPIRQQRWRVPARALWALPAFGALLVGAALLVGGAGTSRAVAVAASHPIVLSSAPASLPAATPSPVVSSRVTAPAPRPSTTTVLAPPPALRRVLFIGDSLIQQAYPTFAVRLRAAGVQTEVLGGPGQSLMSHRGAWLAQLQHAVATFDPDVVVLESCCGNFVTDPVWIGPNAQAVTRDTPAFYAEWRRLATAATVASSARGAAVLWVLGPLTHTNGFYGPIDGWIPKVDAIYQSLAACAPAVGTIDWRTVAAPNGAYAGALPNSAGQLVPIRMSDGFHFTPAGWDVLSNVTLAGVTHAWASGGGRDVPWDGQCASASPNGRGGTT